MINSKKAQVSWFILLGIMFLVGAFIYMYVRTIDSERDFVEPRISEVPFEFVPVSSEVETCMVRVAEDGLRILGTHGGYINMTKWGFVSNSANPTSANAVRFSPGSSLEIPYWFHLKSDNTCTGSCEFEYKAPNLRRQQGEPSIEGQLDEYINNNLKKCINNFADLEYLGYTIEETGPVEAEVTVTAQDIAGYVRYPVLAQKEASAKIEEYFIRLPLDLQTIYEQATLLTSLESNFKYLERNTMNLITGFSAIDKDKLPAMSGLEFNLGGGVTWQRSRVRALLQQILASYVQVMQVYNSYNYEPVSPPAGNKVAYSLYNEGMLIPSNSSYSNLEVTFDYLSFWPIYFDINCNDEFCGPESVAENLMSIIGIQRYNFVYDVSFPVFVEIHDPYALNHQGYDFRFFLEANIRNNDPMPSEFRPLQAAEILTSSLLCNPDQANSGNISVSVVDSEGYPVEEAQIIYTCGSESCNIGKTGPNGSLVAGFPVCFGGFATFAKNDYVHTSKPFTTRLGKNDGLQGVIYPIEEIEVNVMKKNLVKNAGGSWSFRNNPVYLGVSEEAVVRLERKSISTEDKFTTALVYSDEENNTMRLAPGDYLLEISLLTNKDLLMPSQELCAGKDCTTIPEMRINDSYQSGGLKMDFTVSGDDLKKGKVTFYAIGIDPAAVPDDYKEVQDLAQIAKIEEHSAQYRSALNPVFG